MKATEGKRSGIIKRVVASAMAVFLSSMAVQAQSTIGWEFNTLGDTENWMGAGGIISTNVDAVTNADSLGVLVVSPGITGGDAQLVLDGTNSVPVGEYWDTLQIRVRKLISPGGFPDTFDPGGTLAVVTWSLISNGIGDAPWSRVDEAGQWVVAELDISVLGTNDIDYFRIDPPGAIGDGFEIDYIRLTTHTNAPPPPVYKLAWEFNTPGDVEGWDAGNVPGAMIATAVGGSESVLTAPDFSIGDPGLVNNTVAASKPPGVFWSKMRMRMRLTNGGSGIPWEGGDLIVLSHIGVISGANWNITDDGGDGWVIANINIEAIAAGTIGYMRIDPFDSAGGRGFEIDYVRFETRDTPVLPPAPEQLTHTFDFNTIADTEGFVGLNMSAGLTVAAVISGPETALTSFDITGTDPYMTYNNGSANPALFIPAPGAWTTWEIQMRKLTGNPGGGGTIPLEPFTTDGLRFQVNGKTINLTSADVISFTPLTNGWINAVFDISSLGNDDLTYIRVDPTSDETKNFEIDFMKFYSHGSKYDSWSQVVYGLEGTNALTTADFDEDGFNNYYEFAFGGDPTNAANIGYVESEIVEDGGTFFEYRYVRRTDDKNGVDYAFEERATLASAWVDLGDTTEVGTLKTGDDHEIVTNRVDTAGMLTDFFQVKATGE